jgi:hypothetical protein
MHLINTLDVHTIVGFQTHNHNRPSTVKPSTHRPQSITLEQCVRGVWCLVLDANDA